MAYTATASEYTKTYTSFSGCDIMATFGSVVIGELQAISYSVNREKAPVYTLGSAEPRSFSRGKRGIAGRLIFTVFDHDALLEALRVNAAGAAKFQRIGGELNMTPLRIEDWDKQMTERIGGGSNTSISKNVDEVTKKAAIITNPFYDDEVPPFDITISFANEYGQAAALVIYGVEILNEGNGFSIDNVLSQKQCTFVARSVKPLHSVKL